MKVQPRRATARAAKTSMIQRLFVLHSVSTGTFTGVLLLIAESVKWMSEERTAQLADQRAQ